MQKVCCGRLRQQTGIEEGRWEWLVLIGRWKDCQRGEVAGELRYLGAVEVDEGEWGAGSVEGTDGERGEVVVLGRSVRRCWRKRPEGMMVVKGHGAQWAACS